MGPRASEVTEATVAFRRIINVVPIELFSDRNRWEIFKSYRDRTERWSMNVDWTLPAKSRKRLRTLRHIGALLFLVLSSSGTSITRESQVTAVRFRQEPLD